MNNKTRFLLTASLLLLVEVAYFALITLLKFVGNITFNMVMVHLLGLLIMVIYMIIFDGWLRRYRVKIEKRIASLELEQKFTNKRLERIEEKIEHGK